MGNLDNNTIYIKNNYSYLGPENRHPNADYFIAIKTNNKSKKWKIIYIITEDGVLHTYPFNDKFLSSCYNCQRLSYEDNLNRIEKANPDVRLGKTKREFNY